MPKKSPFDYVVESSNNRIKELLVELRYYPSEEADSRLNYLRTRRPSGYPPSPTYEDISIDEEKLHLYRIVRSRKGKGLPVEHHGLLDGYEYSPPDPIPDDIMAKLIEQSSRVSSYLARERMQDIENLTRSTMGSLEDRRDTSPELINASDESTSHSGLDSILERWSDLVMSDISIDQCLKECQLAADYLQQLAEMNMETGNMPRSESESLGEQSGRLIGFLSRASFITGIEYASRIQEPITIGIVRAKAHDALPLFREAAKPAQEYGTQLISGAGASGAISPGKLALVGAEFGRALLHASVNCFELGMRFSSES